MNSTLQLFGSSSPPIHANQTGADEQCGGGFRHLNEKVIENP